MLQTGTAKTEGNTEVLEQLKSTLDNFEMGFEILPGTASNMIQQKKNPFQQDDPAIRGAE